MSIARGAGGASGLVIVGGNLRVTASGGIVPGQRGSLTHSGGSGVLDTTQIVAGTNGGGSTPT